MKATGVWSQKEAESNHQFSPALAKLLAGRVFRNSHSVFDIGCGPGKYVDYLVSQGIFSIGVDGTSFGKQLQHDLTQGFPDDFITGTHAILCLEVAEHIPAEFENIFLSNLVKFSSGLIVLSWAIPEQGGFGHVNERSNPYVIRKMAEYGYNLQPFMTNFLRQSLKRDDCWLFRNSIFFFSC
jgi:2-polyprenyl-3-methyl-5-hydroxy-6-metoxy-1,4-benzoquinol methylase